jgi:hypothetical protein
LSETSCGIDFEACSNGPLFVWVFNCWSGLLASHRISLKLTTVYIKFSLKTLQNPNKPSRIRNFHRSNNQVQAINRPTQSWQSERKWMKNRKKYISAGLYEEVKANLFVVPRSKIFWRRDSLNIDWLIRRS